MKNGWEQKRLPDIAKYFIGLTYSPKDVSNKGTIVLRSSNIQDDKIELSDLVRVNRLVNESLKVRQGDILMCSRNGSKRLVGKTAVIGELPEDMTFGTFMTVIRSKLNPYLAWFFKSDLFRQQIGVGENTMINQVTKYMLDAIQVPLPPPTEQQRIVSILDEAFEAIAAAKTNAERNFQNARALFESYLQFVFTQRDYGWVETTLGEVCEFIGGSQPPKSVFSKIKKADNIRLIQIRDYKSEDHVVYIPRAQARRFCGADDVMIGRYGPPLFQILRGLEGAYNVALMKAAPDESKLSRDFLFYFLKHSSILQYVIYHSERAAGQIGLTKETLEPYPIAVPSLAVQQKVVQNIVGLETQTQRLAGLYERKLDALEALKKSLLRQAFTGQL